MPLAYLHMPHSAFEEGLRLRVTILVQQILFQRPGVDPDANGNASFFRRKQYFPLPLFLAYVAGIDADLGHLRFDSLQGILVIEMNIGDDRHGSALHNIRQRFCIFRARYRHAHNVGSGLGKLSDLVERRLHIMCFGGGHGLHRYRCAAPDLHGTHLHRP